MDEHRPDPAEESRPEDTAASVAGAGSGDTPGGGDDAPLGGDDTTEEQLDADNEVEKDMLKTLDPDDSPA
ncbi:hypothetical protein [Microbacterium abyssi]|uniref:hypothetical protein n=1 Tax=Microbacterium abyssi TaxID=2782166 RepID=UPI0018881CBA|nr:hypothetical protein [Microbacterium sp. A18JL241]